MLGFLQKVRANFGELPLLFRRDNRAGFVEPVGNQIVKLLPIIQLEGKQPELGFEGFVSHSGPVADSSKVSSSFCKLSTKRWPKGRSTFCTWLIIPPSK